MPRAWMLPAWGSIKDIGWNLEVIGTKYLVQLTELKEPQETLLMNVTTLKNETYEFHK